MSLSPLQRAIQRGLQPTGDLFEELDQLPDYPIRSRGDARAVCRALEKFPFSQRPRRAPFVSAVSALVGLFQDVDSFECPAFQVFCDEGLPQLIRIFDAMRKDPRTQEPSDPLFILKILAMYASPAGTERIVEAARDGYRQDDYLWQVVLSVYSEGHPERERLFESLRNPLPGGFMAIAFLDLANEAALQGALPSHPFDSEAGKRLLQKWLTGDNPAENSYAHSATAALPFIGGAERDQLLALAMDHPDPGVQMEGIWAAARLGSTGGLKTLARYCLDVDRSVKARQYLTELGHEDLIPPGAVDPEFQALAEFSDWLTHPNELGCPPDEMEIVDHRRLSWPIDGQEKPFWIIRYRLRDRTGLGEDDVDCGVVGSVTTCHYSLDLGQRSPEDVYAIHCYWEGENAKLIQELEPEDPEEYVGMWRQWPACPVQPGEIIRVVELAPQLKYPQRLVALAALERDGEAGWVVLDGPRSQWYSRSELCGERDFEECGVLRIHIGRHLLGLTPTEDWRPQPARETMQRSPDQIVRAYEALLQEWPTATAQRKRSLLTDVQSPLGEFFPTYIEAKAKLTGKSESACLVETYRLLLRWAMEGDDQWVRVALDNFSPVGTNFRLYVHALVSQGEKLALREIIMLLAPHWDHNLGYCQLGLAAYYGQEWDLAERFFSCLLQSRDEWYKGAEMSLLAEVWLRQGKTGEARQLLVDCLAALHREVEKTPRADRRPLEEWFQGHLATLVRLFPLEAEMLLRRHGIPLPTRRA